jgi:hypothetical protein
LDAAVQRWTAGVHATPSRTAPPPESVLERLPKAEAIALIEGKDKLELVAVAPSGWRLELATGDIDRANFDPATGLVFFLRDQAVWAVDLLEPLADGATPPVVELARLPAKAPKHRPSVLILCVPPPEPRPFATCWPNEPLPSDVDPVPEYLAIEWEDKPAAAWYVPAEEEDEEYDRVELKLVGGDWLRARADRRPHFHKITGAVHNFYQATPLIGAPKLVDRCEDAEDCGKSVPLGVSGWEWVVVGSERGDLFHVNYAVFDPSRQRWANLEQLVAGTATWVPTSEVEASLDKLAVEAYPLFDGGGRVFAGPSDDRLCWFRYAEANEAASDLSCEDAGGRVAAFLSVPTQLGGF